MEDKIFVFYIYAYLREDGTPYYIGKGKGNRAYQKNHSINLPKHRNLIVIMENNLSEIGALALERRYIRWYGRKDNGTGILRNLTDGGEGTTGIIVSEHTKKKISNIRKKQKWSEEVKKKISRSKFGVARPLETRQKMSKSHTGKKMSDEAKKNMRLASLLREQKKRERKNQYS